ncbi:NYN domain-containing protein [Mesobacterium pallidum]|uniref:NYN domain-containing protein n=1 Tax=Mesobacterium pallidum TaxID=2872037 RepID=UPI001EE3A214|nr:NYN domain-containing protein [Mesobacterium pallidum]
MADPDHLLAVLIDADNVPAKYAKAIFDEIATLGEASARRVYGDFSSDRMNSWAKEQGDLGLTPIHQPSFTVKKNSSDIALVIDAMDLMHSGRFDGFVLVSSDSDFIRLANRLREQGLGVYGMGEKKTHEAFRKACKRFIYLENLGSNEDEKAPAPKSESKLDEARKLILRAMDSVEQEDEWVTLGQIGQQITALHPDFDTRTYGKRKLSELVTELKIFESRNGPGNQLQIRRLD